MHFVSEILQKKLYRSSVTVEDSEDPPHTPALLPEGCGAITASLSEAFWPNLLCRGRVLSENDSEFAPVPRRILFLVIIKIHHQYIFTVLFKSLHL